jgi:hypothetical protein
MGGQLAVGGEEFNLAVAEALALAQGTRAMTTTLGASFGTGRRKLVCNCTLVIALNSPSLAIIASSMAVSAAATMACPHSTPPPWMRPGATGRTSLTPSSSTAWTRSSRRFT